MIKDHMQHELSQLRRQDLMHEAEQHRLVSKPARRGAWRRWLPRLAFAQRPAPEQPLTNSQGLLVPGRVTPQ